MTTFELTLTLPEALAHEAKSIGLLEPQSLVRLLTAEVERQKRIQQLFAAADKLAALDLPPLSDAELEAEISATRLAKHNSDAGRR